MNILIIYEIQNLFKYLTHLSLSKSWVFLSHENTTLKFGENLKMLYYGHRYDR